MLLAISQNQKVQRHIKMNRKKKKGKKFLADLKETSTK